MDDNPKLPEGNMYCEYESDAEYSFFIFNFVEQESGLVLY